MNPTDAALVLAWIVLVLLAFACAGILRQVRLVQAEVAELRQANRHLGPTAREFPEQLLPTGGAELTMALLVSPGCTVCEEVTPVFTREAKPAREGVDFAVVTWADGDQPRDVGHARWVDDGAAYRFLDPGWTPAVLTLDATGKVLAAEPAGSVAAVESLVGHAANRQPRQVGRGR